MYVHSYRLDSLISMVKTSFILHIHRKPLEMMGDDQDGVCNWYSSEEEELLSPLQRRTTVKPFLL